MAGRPAGGISRFIHTGCGALWRHAVPRKAPRCMARRRVRTRRDAVCVTTLHCGTASGVNEPLVSLLKVAPIASSRSLSHDLTPDTSPHGVSVPVQRRSIQRIFRDFVHHSSLGVHHSFLLESVQISRVTLILALQCGVGGGVGSPTTPGHPLYSSTAALSHRIRR